MKKGFTLIEILGVVIIIGLLLLIIAPPVLNQVNSHSDEVSELQSQMIKDAADLYLDSNQAASCITIQQLKDKGFLNANIIDVIKKDPTFANKKVKVTKITKPRKFEFPGDC